LKMVKIRSASIAVLTVIATVITNTPQLQAAGRSATAAVNTILNGRGAPKSSLGIDGDFYIDTRSLQIYGPKSKGKWPSAQSIQGPTGPSGNDGRNGSDGKAITNSNASSQVGPQGAQGEKGEKGDQGLPGIAGAQGLPGIAGPAGSPGISGSSGANGSQGATGPQGPAGARGETGTSGAAEVFVVDIPNWTLNTGSTFSFASSTSVGLLSPGNSYKFEIYIYGTSSLASLVIGADVVASNSTVDFSYLRSDSRYSTYNSASFRYSFLITGVVKDILAQTGITVRIIDAYGETGAGALTLNGKAYITPVGRIG